MPREWRIDGSHEEAAGNDKREATVYFKVYERVRTL